MTLRKHHVLQDTDRLRPLGVHSILLVLAACLAWSCSGGAGNANGVPVGLSSIEGSAEDAYDQALAVHFVDVATDAKSIDDGWRAFRSEAAAAGARTEDLKAMDSAVAGLLAAAMSPTDAIVLARAANAVSATMDELYGLYESPEPPEVLALDYLGREVVLDARQGDYGNTTTHIDMIEATFGTIRSGLLAADGSQVATEYESSVAAMRADVTSKDAAKLESDANVGLELVDRMEGVFAKAAGG